MRSVLLSDIHEMLSAEMGGFHGYNVPMRYLGREIFEYFQVRKSVGIMDVAHKSQIFLKGKNVTEVLEKVTPCTYSDMKTGHMVYTVIVNNDGATLDDVIVAKLSDNEYLLIVSAFRKIADADWIKYNISKESEVYPEMAEDRVLVAVQGPEAVQVMSSVADYDMSEIPHMEIKSFADVHVMRAGFTGEDGFMVSSHYLFGRKMWMSLINDERVSPTGMTAQNILRIESGYPLYGKDLDETVSVSNPSVKWAIYGNNPNFKINGGDSGRIRVGLSVNDATGVIIRDGADVIDSSNGLVIGTVTSAIYSPHFRHSICQAKIDADTINLSSEGRHKIKIAYKGKEINAVITPFPLYKNDNAVLMYNSD